MYIQNHYALVLCIYSQNVIDANASEGMQTRLFYIFALLQFVVRIVPLA